MGVRELDVLLDVGVLSGGEAGESYITHCQLRGSSESISPSGEQCCSSMKTRVRTCIASLKVGGFCVGVWLESVGRVRGVFGPGGGWMVVVKVCPVVGVDKGLEVAIKIAMRSIV